MNPPVPSCYFPLTHIHSLLLLSPCEKINRRKKKMGKKNQTKYSLFFSCSCFVSKIPRFSSPFLLSSFIHDRVMTGYAIPYLPLRKHRVQLSVYTRVRPTQLSGDVSHPTAPKETLLRFLFSSYITDSNCLLLDPAANRKTVYSRLSIYKRQKSNLFPLSICGAGGKFSFGRGRRSRL